MTSLPHGCLFWVGFNVKLRSHKQGAWWGPRSQFHQVKAVFLGCVVIWISIWKGAKGDPCSKQISKTYPHIRMKLFVTSGLGLDSPVCEIHDELWSRTAMTIF